jgi:purine-cytosine permease-like protein
VASISTYPRARGARDGAIAGGLVGFTVGFTFGILLGALTSTSEGGERPDPAIVGLKVGGGLGAIVALLGAGLGALAGHEERFDLAP